MRHLSVIPALLAGLLASSVPPAGAQGILPLETSRIARGRWSYEIRVQGRVIATLESIVREEEGRLVSISRVRGADRQHTKVEVRASDLEPLRSLTDNRGAEGSRLEAEVFYAPAGDSLSVVRRVVADTGPEGERFPPRSTWRVAAADTYDLYSLDLVLASLPLEEPDGAWTFRLLDLTSHEPITVRARTLPPGTVTTPAGRSEVWRVRVEGQAMPAEYAFRRGDRVLVAQRLPTQGVEILLSGPGPR